MDDLVNGTQLLQTATQLRPTEDTFQEELSYAYAKVALALNQQQIATQAALFTQAALDTSQNALRLNPVHLNIYKTRARVLMLFAEIDSQYLISAGDVIRLALQLAPTDAKLWYYLGLVEKGQGHQAEAMVTLTKTVAIKPNYDAARTTL